MRARITALASAILPERMAAPRKRLKLEPVREFIDLILEADLQAPRKQRHTAHRIFCRLREERSSSEIAERTVRWPFITSATALDVTSRFLLTCSGSLILEPSFGWLARVTLRSSIKASKTSRRFKSRVLKFIM